WKPPPRTRGDSERLGSVPGKQFHGLLAGLRDEGLRPVDEGEFEVDGEEPRRLAHWSAPHDWPDARHLDAVGRVITDLGGTVRGRPRPNANGHTNGEAVGDPFAAPDEEEM